MLQQEPQEQSAAPSAQIRVTAEELAQAINALEASKEEQAQHLAGTVPIGQVVDELKLEATPDEVWAQVQKQRARQAADSAAAQAAAEARAAQKQAARLAAMQALPQPRQRRRRRWWMVLGVGWIAFGIAHGHFSPPHKQSPSLPSIIVHGDGLKQTFDVGGKDVMISGNGSTIYLHGKASSVVVLGDNDKVIGDSISNTPRSVITHGSGDTVTWSGIPAGDSSDNAHNSHDTVKTGREQRPGRDQ